MRRKVQVFKQLMKADACDYGDGLSTARKGSKRMAEHAAHADEAAPKQATPLDTTPAAAHENGRFLHMQHTNGHSTAGTALSTYAAETMPRHWDMCVLLGQRACSGMASLQQKFW